MKPSLSISLLIAGFSPLCLKAADPIAPLPYVVPAVVKDTQEEQLPDRVQLSGMLGARIKANTYTRLLETVDVDRLLEGYRNRPGCMTWDGEHIGKFIHAATLAWANSGDEKLRAKVASAVAELIKCQEADGYLGTYLSDNQPPAPESLSAASESQSRIGNVKGSLIQEKLVSTYDGSKQEQDWYAVTLAKPSPVGWVVFTHGANYPNGGWFDASQGKPQVQVQTEKDGPWTTVGEFASYPATTATDPKPFNPHSSGTRFNCTLAKPVTAYAVRVIGKPACGDKPDQSFSSCAELAIYEH